MVETGGGERQWRSEEMRVVVTAVERSIRAGRARWVFTLRGYIILPKMKQHHFCKYVENYTLLVNMFLKNTDLVINSWLPAI